MYLHYKMKDEHKCLSAGNLLDHLYVEFSLHCIASSHFPRVFILRAPPPAQKPSPGDNY